MAGAILDGRGSYEYSNFGYAVLGAALEAATGKAYADMIAELIFEPVGMFDYFVWASDAPARDVVPGMDADGRAAMSWQMGAFAPAGGVVLNVADMACFMRALFDGNSPIGIATRLAFEPRCSPGHGASVGLGWQCSGALRWHNGETYSHYTMLAVDEETSSGVVAFWNAAASVDDTCLHLLDTKQPLVELPTEVVVSKARLDALVGTYDAGSKRRLVVTLEDTRLRLSDPLLGSFRIYPRDDRTFFRRSLAEGDYAFSIDLTGEIVLEQRRAGVTVFRPRRLSS
jgi:D-alanyl-D-alanine-carboxypeptidase/D-alanyl-D-alanine-endopeptidase